MDNEPLHSPPLSGPGFSFPWRAFAPLTTGWIGKVTSTYPYRRLRRTIQLLLGIACLGGFLVWFGPDTLATLLSVDLAFLIGAFGCTLAIVLCIGLRWSMLVQAVSASSPRLLESCRYFLLNRVIGFVVPKDLSDVAGRVFLLTTRHGVPPSEAAVSVFLDRLFDLALALTLLGPALLFLSGVVSLQGFALSLLVLLLTAGATLFLAGEPLVSIVFGLYRSFRTQAGRVVPGFKTAPGLVAPEQLSGRVLVKALGFSALKFCATTLRFIGYARAVSLTAPPAVFVAGTPITQLSFLLAFTPGGLGLLEATWYGVLTHADFAGPDVVRFLLVQRVGTMVLVGVLALVLEIWHSLSPDGGGDK